MAGNALAGRRAIAPVLGGIIVCVVVLAAATAFGLSRQRRDGKLRRVAGSRTGPESAAAESGELEPSGPRAVGQPASGPRLTAAQLGEPLGRQATLLQFSSPMCAPCRATRRILDEVASGADGVAHIEVNATERLDLVRLLDVRRTPTVFVLDPGGRVARRGTGLMPRAEVLQALGDTR